MMTATPNDVRFANDVCLAAHFMANIASLRHKVAQHHFEQSEKHHIAAGDASLLSANRFEPPHLKCLQSCGMINTRKAVDI